MRYSNAPEVKVGIITAQRIRIRLNGHFMDENENSVPEGEITLIDRGGRIEYQSQKAVSISDEVYLRSYDHQNCSFRVFDVTIGIGFHWQKEEDQVFNGSLKAVSGDKGITLINILRVEDYLVSVISSEMRATSSAEMLKAHAVISRSWLLAQIEKGSRLKTGQVKYQSSFYSDDEIIKWYDREDHAGFDVCADDHCQRYQGITRAFAKQASDAVRETQGEVLLYNDSLCDARFSKCCGGMTERFENAWEPVPHPYLQRIYDNDDPSEVEVDLTLEENAGKWILSSPSAFCNTTDRKILLQVLNDYDQSTHDFFRLS